MVQLQIQSLLLEDPVLQVLLLLQEAEEVAADVRAMAVGMGKGVVDMEVDQGGSTRGKEVTFRWIFKFCN